MVVGKSRYRNSDHDCRPGRIASCCGLVSGGVRWWFAFWTQTAPKWLTTTYERAKYTGGSTGRLPGQSAQLNSVQSRHRNS